MLLINYSLFYQNFHLHNWGNYNTIKIHESLYEEEVQGKKTLVLGEGKSIYKDAESVATKFYNWPLSSEIWNETNDPQQLAMIYDDLIKNEPESIIDLSGVAEEALEKLPEIRKKYRKVNAKVYVLRDGE